MLKPKTEQMRNQRERDAWMGNIHNVRAALRANPKLRGRKLEETALYFTVICNAPRAKLLAMGWKPANVAKCRAILRTCRDLLELERHVKAGEAREEAAKNPKRWMMAQFPDIYARMAEMGPPPKK